MTNLPFPKTGWVAFEDTYRALAPPCAQTLTLSCPFPPFRINVHACCRGVAYIYICYSLLVAPLMLRLVGGIGKIEV